MNDKEKKIKMFKSQIKLFTITAIVQSIIIGIFLIFFHEPLAVVIFLIVVLVVLWGVAALKITSAVKGIKDLNQR